MKLKLHALLTTALLSAAAFSANALTVVASPAGTGINVISNACDASVTPTSGATTVFGCLNVDHAQKVSLTSDENLVITCGQATLDSADGVFGELTISVVDKTLTSVIFNIDATADGTVTFSDGDGVGPTFNLDGNGQNFFTITGVAGGFLSFETSGQIVADVKQIRLNAVGVIPEPETYALMLAGLGALGFVARRRKAAR